MNLENTVKKASQILKNHNIHSHELDAQIILSDIMEIKREFLITNNEINISEKIMEKYDIAIKRRIKREPVAYIIGKKEFWSHNFRVNQSTLIPRPESELLIYKLVNYFKNRRINILDIGTGSGCILLSLLKELHLSRGIGIDISSKAIKTAKLNSKKLNLFYRSKFKVVGINNFNIGRYDLIVSNPPYIESENLSKCMPEVRQYEPAQALDGGRDGLDYYRFIVPMAWKKLEENGLLVLEIGHTQASAVIALMQGSSRYQDIQVIQDYSGYDRVVLARTMNG